MTPSDLESNNTLESPEGDSRVGVSLATLVVVTVTLLPSSVFLVVWSLIVFTNNLDVAFALGVSDAFVSGIVIAVSGLVTGIIVAVVAKERGWRSVAPPVAGLIVGLGIFLGFLAFAPGEGVDVDNVVLIIIGVGQVIAIVASTRIAGHSLAAVAGVLVALGIAAAVVIEAIPEPRAEVVLVLDLYTVDDATGGCSGAAELAGVGEGAEVVLVEYAEMSGRPTEVGSVSLPAGVEDGGGCVFQLGSPLDRPVLGYENIDFVHESDPGVPYSISLEGKRVFISMFGSES